MPRTLEITVVSAENLTIGRKPVKKNAFVTVKTDPFNTGTTTPDPSGGSYPSWNQKFHLQIPADSRLQFVTIEAFSGNKRIGTACAPFNDFMGGYAPKGYLNFLSYRLRDDFGGRNGIVNISVRVKSGVDERVPARKEGAAERGAWGVGFWKTTAGFPAGKTASDSRFNGGVVIGVPVSCGYHQYRV